MRFPDFLIIGAQKSGTTWLRELLRSHPDIYMPPKEVHFFDDQDLYTKGIEWYASRFADARPDQTVGEKTPNYLWLPARPGFSDGARRIHDVLPDARLIVIFRNPVTRALSALNHVVTLGEVSPLHSADELLGGRKQHLLTWPVLEMGKYDVQLEAFFEVYDRSQFLILFFEDDVIGNPARTWHRVCEFLGVPQPTKPEERLSQAVNKPRASVASLALKHHLPMLYEPTLRLTRLFPRYYPKISVATRERLHRMYEPHNERLFELLGRRPSSGWSIETSRNGG